MAFYTTVLQDGDEYRMYYRGQLFKGKTTCYAESRDGIRWTKPLKFDGNQLEIHYSTSAAGMLRIEIRDEQGQPVPHDPWNLLCVVAISE